jgi:hypothetical protein
MTSLLIFPRSDMKMELTNWASPGSIYTCRPSGWIQSDSFIQWFSHFLRHVDPIEECPIILVVECHYSRVHKLEVVKLGRKKYVSITCLPPYSTHKIHALDLAFIDSFYCYYSQEMVYLLRSNPGRVLPSTAEAKFFNYLELYTWEQLLLKMLLVV